VDTLNNKIDLLKAIIVCFDIFVLEPFKIKLFKIFTDLCGRLELCVSKFVIKSSQPLFVEEVIDPLAAFAAEVELFVPLFLLDHHLFIKFEIAVGACYLGQWGSLFDPDYTIEITQLAFIVILFHNPGLSYPRFYP
jgi:hypothetical protein